MTASIEASELLMLREAVRLFLEEIGDGHQGTRETNCEAFGYCVSCGEETYGHEPGCKLNRAILIAKAALALSEPPQPLVVKAPVDRRKMWELLEQAIADLKQADI